MIHQVPDNSLSDSWSEEDQRMEKKWLMATDKEVVDYRPRYDPKGIDITKTKNPEGIHGPVLSISECHAQTDNILSHIYDMKMLQLRMNGVTEERLQQLNMDYPLSEHSRDLCRVGPIFEEPLDDDDAMRIRRESTLT
ncbi:hypothetical protein HAX54_039040 [Datura stramonium]|uniref:Uncharacterized protein n=1 Tax=Datura stramonium TaxID=4076 RepID=A0ABS8VP34_DATST|nr:hypothetical protein [Datura stramonium]